MGRLAPPCLASVDAGASVDDRVHDSSCVQALNTQLIRAMTLALQLSATIATAHDGA
jgi:hypothetical protein